MTLTSSAGTARPGAAGSRVAPGEVVTTAPGGAAALATRDRRLLLGPSTSVGVVDGATFDLRAGAVLADRRRGPGLEVRAAEVRVSDIRPGAVRIVRGYTVRVAVLAGAATVQTRTGRRSEVPALHEITATGSALPSSVPLALSSDAWDRLVVPGVVALDAQLNRFAGALDGATGAITPAAVSQQSIPRSETLLASAITRAAARRGDAATLRQSGGSWGVIATLLAATFARISGALSALAVGTPGIPGLTPGAGTPTGGAGPGQPSPSAGFSPQPTRTPGPGGTGQPTPTPTRSATSSPSPSQSPDVVDQVQDTVEELLPTPTPSMSPLLPLPELPIIDDLLR